MKRAIAELIACAKSYGWIVKRTAGGHLRMTHPNGALIYSASTPSDWRATRNAVARLRRAERTAEHSAAVRGLS
jgi:hypothetical protein